MVFLIFYVIFAKFNWFFHWSRKIMKVYYLNSIEKELSFDMQICTVLIILNPKIHIKKLWTRRSKKHTNLDIDSAYSTKATALEWPPNFFCTFRVPRIENNGGYLVRREVPVPPLGYGGVLLYWVIIYRLPKFWLSFIFIANENVFFNW